MYILAICIDGPDGPEKRSQHREDHLAYLGALGERIKLAGPLLDASGDTPKGSMIILEADNPQHAGELLDADPYAKAGVFQDRQLVPWRGVLGEWWSASTP